MIEYAAPKESNNAHRIIFSNPIDTSRLLLDNASIQNANRKMAGVRIKTGLMLGMNFFMAMVMVMGIRLARLGLCPLGRLTFEA